MIFHQRLNFFRSKISTNPAFLGIYQILTHLSNSSAGTLGRLRIHLVVLIAKIIKVLFLFQIYFVKICLILRQVDLKFEITYVISMVDPPPPPKKFCPRGQKTHHTAGDFKSRERKMLIVSFQIECQTDKFRLLIHLYLVL